MGDRGRAGIETGIRLRGVMYLVALCLAAPIAFGGTLNVAPPVEMDGYVAIPITFESVSESEVSSLQFDVQFDASAYNVVDIQAGEAANAAFKAPVFSEPVDGRTRVVVAGFNQQAINDGTLAYVLVTRNGDASDNASVRLDRVVLSDPMGNPVAFDNGDDEIESEPEAERGELPQNGDTEPLNDSPPAESAQPVEMANGEMDEGLDTVLSAFFPREFPQEELNGGDRDYESETGEHRGDPDAGAESDKNGPIMTADASEGRGSVSPAELLRRLRDRGKLRGDSSETADTVSTGPGARTRPADIAYQFRDSAIFHDGALASVETAAGRALDRTGIRVHSEVRQDSPGFDNNNGGEFEAEVTRPRLEAGLICAIGLSLAAAFTLFLRRGLS